MKIIDVTLTLTRFAWEGLQPVAYSAHMRSTRTSWTWRCGTSPGRRRKCRSTP
jgi:hypothetical protein